MDKEKNPYLGVGNTMRHFVIITLTALTLGAQDNPAPPKTLAPPVSPVKTPTLNIVPQVHLLQVQAPDGSDLLRVRAKEVGGPDWSDLFQRGALWTFHIEGKDYNIDAARLLEIVQADVQRAKLGN